MKHSKDEVTNKGISSERTNILHRISLRLLLAFILIPIFPLSAETINEYEPSKFEYFLFYFIFMPGLFLVFVYVFIKLWHEVKAPEAIKEFKEEFKKIDNPLGPLKDLKVFYKKPRKKRK